MFAVTNAQDWIFEEKEIKTCCTPDPLRKETQGYGGVIIVQDTINGLRLSMFHDSDIGLPGVFERCRNERIKRKYMPNSIKIADNAPIPYEEKFIKQEGIYSTENYIPEKIIYLKKGDTQFVVIELFLFMSCSISGISGGYNSLIIRLDKENVVKGFSISAFYRRSISKDRLIDFLEKSFKNQI
jgi:hypothetical protein